MSDMIGLGLAYLTDQLATHASIRATYWRGSDSASIRATLDSQLLKLDDGLGGFRLEWTDLDILVPAVDLVLAGLAVTPRRGDRLELSLASGLETFEVRPFGHDPAWRWSDPNQSQMRIHLKHIEPEAYS
jgi:hypothetical protein